MVVSRPTTDDHCLLGAISLGDAGGQSSGVIHCYPPSSTEQNTVRTVRSSQTALTGLQKQEEELMAGVHSRGFRNLGQGKMVQEWMSGLWVPFSSLRVQAGTARSCRSLRLTTSGLNLPPLITSFPGNRSPCCLPRCS